MQLKRTICVLFFASVGTANGYSAECRSFASSLTTNEITLFWGGQAVNRWFYLFNSGPQSVALVNKDTPIVTIFPGQPLAIGKSTEPWHLKVISGPDIKNPSAKIQIEICMDDGRTQP